MAELVLLVGQPVESFADDLASPRIVDRRARRRGGNRHRGGHEADHPGVAQFDS